MYDLELWKKAKKAKKLTLEDIAKKSNIGISTIKDIFRGVTYAPRIDTVEAIEKVLGISSTKKESITPIEDDMLYIFREIGKKHGIEAQQALITVAEKML